MKNLETIAKNSQSGTKIYYSIREDAVFTDSGQGRIFVTELIRHNTEQEIMEAVRRFLAM